MAKGFLLSTADQKPAPPKDFYLSTARTTLPMYVNDQGVIVDKDSAEYAAWYANESTWTADDYAALDYP